MSLFCPKCSSLLRLKKEKEKRFLLCSCGYREEKRIEVKEEIPAGKKIGVIEKTEILPETEAECPNCGNKKAYYWMQQTRAADEAETRFFKCQKCSHVWREYS